MNKQRVTSVQKLKINEKEITSTVYFFLSLLLFFYLQEEDFKTLSIKHRTPC